MDDQLLEILTDIRSELSFANIFRAYELKLHAIRDSHDFRSQVYNEVTKVANEYLNSVKFDEEENDNE